MAVSMRSIALGAFAALLTISAASALECVKCTHFDWTGDAPADKATMMESVRNNNPQCQEPTADVSAMKETCGAGETLTDGTVVTMGCGKVMAEHDDEDTGFSASAVWRGCMPMKADKGAHCMDDDDRDEKKMLKGMVMMKMMGMKDADMDIKGMMMEKMGDMKEGKGDKTGEKKEGLKDGVKDGMDAMEDKMDDMGDVDGHICVCEGDLCNGSSAVSFTLFSLLAGLLAFYLW